MRVIDERFLTVHPRTALWWEQRKLCAQCKHVIVIDNAPRSAGASQSVMCAARPGRTRFGHATCIDAREEGQPCGPEGKMFSAR